MGYDEQIPGAGARHVPHPLTFERLLAPLLVACRRKFGWHHPAEHPMQRVVGSAMDELRRLGKGGGRVNRDDDWPFQTLRLVDSDDLHSFVRGIDAPLRTRRTGFPVGLHVSNEGAQT